MKFWHLGALLAFVFAVVLAACGSSGAGDSYVVRGLRAFEEQDYDLAIAQLERAVEVGVSKYSLEEVYSVLGRAYESTNQFNKAIDAHQKALEINPKYYKAWVNLGVAYRLNGNLEEAERSYNQALSIESNYAELHASLGALYIFQNEPEKALSALNRAIELDPQLPVARANIAVAYAMVGQFDLAKRALDEATRLGYQNSAIIQARIEALKALQKENGENGEN
jgi:tetratricopeptide (TPR) repeat protein